MPGHEKKQASLVAAVFSLTLLGSGCTFMPPPNESPTTGPSLDRQAPRLAPLDTSHFEGVPASVELVGGMQVLFARYENTFADIARQYDVGYEALRGANPGVDQWLPGAGTPIYLPTRQILPDAPREGIVVNLAAMRLFHFWPAAGREARMNARVDVTTHPIGIGRSGWSTPTGAATVIEKVRDPAWYVPASVRKEHAARGDPLPPVVPAGPDNPLGRFALQLSMPGYLIHGTNKPAGVGMRVSHGCIRLYPEDIETLFRAVPRGTRVRIVDQPVLAGWADGELYLEVHPPLDGQGGDLAAEADKVIAAVVERAGAKHVSLDREAIARVVAERRGIPLPVGNARRTLDEYLSASRIVANTVPVSENASTASTLARTATAVGAASTASPAADRPVRPRPDRRPPGRGNVSVSD